MNFCKLQLYSMCTLFLLLLVGNMQAQQVKIKPVSFDTKYGYIENDSFHTESKHIIINHAERFIHVGNDAFPYIWNLTHIDDTLKTVEYTWTELGAKNPRTGFFLVDELGAIKLMILNTDNTMSVYSQYQQDVVNGRHLLDDQRKIEEGEQHKLYEIVPVVPKKHN